MDQQLLRELKIQLRRHMNGTTAALMKSLDNPYKANYGISLQHARDIAATHPLSPDDCIYLWNTQWRDLMLIAAAAMLPHDPEPATLLPWVDTIPSVEMTQMLPFLLTGRITHAPALAVQLAQRAHTHDLTVAFATLARHVQFNPSPDDAPAAQSLLTIALSLPQYTAPQAQALSLLARQCLRSHIALPLIQSLLSLAQSRPDTQSQLLATQIADEQSFLSGDNDV